MAIRTTIPSEKEIIALFDELVKDGIIVYGPYRSVKQDAGGYPVCTYPPFHLLRYHVKIILTCAIKLEFRICPVFARKPHTIGAKLDRTFDTSSQNQWGPGSDLYCPDDRMKIAQVNGMKALS